MDIDLNFKGKRIKAGGILLVTLLVAACLRLYKLAFQSAWIDEIHTLRESDPELSFKEFNDIMILREGIPHLYFLVIRSFRELFGHDLLVARGLSAIAGVASVYAIYLLGKELLNKRTGYIASILLAVNLFNIEHSQEARSYSILVLFVILASYRLLLFLKAPTMKNAVFLGLFTGLISQAHPIGVMNIAAIALILFLVLLFEVPKRDKKAFFKHCFVAGIITLVIFAPVYPLFAKASGLESFWVAAPTMKSILTVIITLFSYSALFAAAFVIALLYFIVKVMQNKTRGTLQSENLNRASLVLGISIVVELTILLVKSYSGTSMILGRYFIGLMPFILLIVAIAIELVPNRPVKKGIVVVLASLCLYAIVKKDYYNTLTKAQFSAVVDEIKKHKFSKHPVVSNWGWQAAYYFDTDNQSQLIERNLEKHVNDMMAGTENPESFWYMDGNSRPFELSPSAYAYLHKNFIQTDVINKHDAWARHFKSRISGPPSISIRKFKPSMFDGSGALIFVQNQVSTHPALDLDAGSYTITFNGLSLPEQPINGENAHFKLLANGAKIGDFYLSNIPDKPSEITFVHSGGTFILGLEYDNDVTVGAADRNALFRSIILKKNN